MKCLFELKKKNSLSYFRQREGREKKKERSMCVVSCTPPTGDLTWCATQACALTGNQTGDPWVHRPVLNPLSHISQGQGSNLNCYLASCLRESCKFIREALHIPTLSAWASQRKIERQPYRMANTQPAALQSWATVLPQPKLACDVTLLTCRRQYLS